MHAIAAEWRLLAFSMSASLRACDDVDDNPSIISIPGKTAFDGSRRSFVFFPSFSVFFVLLLSECAMGRMYDMDA